MHVRCNAENIHQLWSCVKWRGWVFLVKEMELEGTYKHNTWKASLNKIKSLPHSPYMLCIFLKWFVCQSNTLCISSDTSWIFTVNRAYMLVCHFLYNRNSVSWQDFFFCIVNISMFKWVLPGKFYAEIFRKFVVILNHCTTLNQNKRINIILVAMLCKNNFQL